MTAAPVPRRLLRTPVLSFEDGTALALDGQQSSYERESPRFGRPPFNVFDLMAPMPACARP